MTEIFRVDIANVLLKQRYHMYEVKPDLSIGTRLCFVFEENIDNGIINDIVLKIDMQNGTTCCNCIDGKCIWLNNECPQMPRQYLTCKYCKNLSLDDNN